MMGTGLVTYMKFIWLVLIFTLSMVTLSHADSYHRGDDGVFMSSNDEKSVSAQIFHLMEPVTQPNLYSEGIKIYHRTESPSVYQVILHPSEVFSVQNQNGKAFVEVGGRAVSLFKKAFERKSLKPNKDGILGEGNVWCKVGEKISVPYCTVTVNNPTK